MTCRTTLIYSNQCGLPSVIVLRSVGEIIAPLSASLASQKTQAALRVLGIFKKGLLDVHLQKGRIVELATVEGKGASKLVGAFKSKAQHFAVCKLHVPKGRLDDFC